MVRVGVWIRDSHAWSAAALHAEAAANRDQLPETHPRQEHTIPPPPLPSNAAHAGSGFTAITTKDDVVTLCCTTGMAIRLVGQAQNDAAVRLI